MKDVSTTLQAIVVFLESKGLSYGKGAFDAAAERAFLAGNEIRFENTVSKATISLSQTPTSNGSPMIRLRCSGSGGSTGVHAPRYRERLMAILHHLQENWTAIEAGFDDHSADTKLLERFERLANLVTPKAHDQQMAYVLIEDGQYVLTYKTFDAITMHRVLIALRCITNPHPNEASPNDQPRPMAQDPQRPQPKALDPDRPNRKPARSRRPRSL